MSDEKTSRLAELKKRAEAVSEQTALNKRKERDAANKALTDRRRWADAWPAIFLPALDAAVEGLNTGLDPFAIKRSTRQRVALGTPPSETLEAALSGEVAPQTITFTLLPDTGKIHVAIEAASRRDGANINVTLVAMPIEHNLNLESFDPAELDNVLETYAERMIAMLEKKATKR